jgi:hypothetical protein
VRSRAVGDCLRCSAAKLMHSLGTVEFPSPSGYFWHHAPAREAGVGRRCTEWCGLGFGVGPGNRVVDPEWKRVTHHRPVGALTPGGRTRSVIRLTIPQRIGILTFGYLCWEARATSGWFGTYLLDGWRDPIWANPNGDRRGGSFGVARAGGGRPSPMLLGRLCLSSCVAQHGSMALNASRGSTGADCHSGCTSAGVGHSLRRTRDWDAQPVRASAGS